jgi:hypothetical protein
MSSIEFDARDRGTPGVDRCGPEDDPYGDDADTHAAACSTAARHASSLSSNRRLTHVLAARW